ncbi:unnamed protein product [Rotaria magnacalcarata]|uniref:Uncharacterized protein n=1 Tax=Rotaria magnacalcarata TaxID=392030 RepID=A0A815BXS8_9BILA|nr:unnamed protein product [Rotaria magnacalcarata]
MAKDPTPEDIFNELNIRYRICFKPVKKSGDAEEGICVCNRRVEDHDDRVTESGAKKWDMLRNTYEEVNPAHGHLVNGALFTRLALDTSEGKVEKILLDAWKIPKPRLIMSIIGGAKYFTLSDRLETNFINGIIDVALKSGAWLITNGYNVGIVQLVGQAINKVKLTNPKRQITAIGLCKWGSVKDVEKLPEPLHTRKQRVNNRHCYTDSDDKLKKRESGERDLEMNHSHYLMLDDGRLRHYDIGDYRTRLCAHLAKLERDDDFPVPVVTIVVEGGRDTITNIYNDLRANIPVVIIDGSGRVADFFKHWLLYTKEFDDASKDADIAYEINEIDKVERVTSATSNQESLSDSRTSYTNVRLQLDKSRNVLREMFRKYEAQLQADLNPIINRDEDSNKKKRKPPLLVGSKDEPSITIDKTFSQVMYCLQPAVRSGISVFNLNSENNFSETIFRSICKSRKKYFERKETDQNDTLESNLRKLKPLPNSQDKKRQSNARRNVNRKDQNAQRTQLLQLAMDWNCIDVAKELILENSLDNILNKEHTFIYALTKDLPTFVYEFLKLGIDPSKIFFPNDEFFRGTNRYKKFIGDLYTDAAVNSNTTHLRWFVESDSDISEKHIQRTDDLNAVISVLIGDYMSKLYFDSDRKEMKYRSLWGLNKEDAEQNAIPVEIVTDDDDLFDRENRQKVEDYVMRDLFLWSILMYHVDLAKVFLSYLKYRICAALIATKILKEYHRKATHGELKDSYMKNADYFQQYAIDCVTQCEKNDPDQACQIILQRIELYGNVTCLQVAADAHDKLFIATPCCVQAMNNIWFDKIYPEQSRKRNNISMGLGFISLGLLAPFLVNYRNDGGEPKDESLTRRLQPYGINYSDAYTLEYPRYTKISSLNRYMHRVKNFHQALRMKYFYHCLSYIVFLLLFSYMILFNFQLPTDKIPSIHWTEIVTIILVSSMLIEEIHCFVSMDNLSFPGKCFNYFRNLFKIMAIVGFILFYVGLVLRFTYTTTDEEFFAARIVMAIDLEIWWLRSLSFIIVVRFLGPHIVAIGKMLKDLAFFMCIIAIVMTGYGVASRAMAYYPNANRFNETGISTEFNGRDIFRQIAYPVYYLMYGEFGTELDDLDTNRDEAWSISTHVLLAVHMLFVNILLTNLLIAMFSKRFDQVYEDTQNIWHTQQYIFTREYYTRAPFFPPISLIYDMYYLCRLTFFNIRRVCFKKSADPRAKTFKMIPINKSCVKDWYQFEGASTYEYAHQEVKASKAVLMTSSNGSDSRCIEKREDSNDSVNDSNNNIRQIQDDLAKLNQSFEDIKGQLKTLIEKS